MLQTKQNNSEKGPNEMEISNMPDEAFKVMIIKLLTRLEWRVEVLSKNVNKEKIWKKSELKNISTLVGINILAGEEEQNNNLEYGVMENTQAEQQKEKAVKWGQVKGSFA